MGKKRRRSALLAESKNQQLLLQAENDTDSSEELHIASKVDIYINPSAFRKEKPSDRFIPVPLKKIFSTIESHQLASSQNFEEPTTSKMCSAQLEKQNIECLLRDKHIKLTKESTKIYRMQDDIFNSIVNDTKKFKNIHFLNYYKIKSSELLPIADDEKQRREKYIEDLARRFKKARIKEGISHDSMTAILKQISGKTISSTTISHFESLNLSFKDSLQIAPILHKWLTIVEAESSAEANHDTREVDTEENDNEWNSGHFGDAILTEEVVSDMFGLGWNPTRWNCFWRPIGGNQANSTTSDHEDHKPSKPTPTHWNSNAWLKPTAGSTTVDRFFHNSSRQTEHAKNENSTANSSKTETASNTLLPQTGLFKS
ncbi:POU domain, class 3, transcription factor 1-A, partial [Trichinella britovi]